MHAKLKIIQQNIKIKDISLEMNIFSSMNIKSVLSPCFLISPWNSRGYTTDFLSDPQLVTTGINTEKIK